MESEIEPCPFCHGHFLHITRHLVSYSVTCQTCKSSGPFRRTEQAAVEEWNNVSKAVHSRQSEEEPSESEKRKFSIAH